MADSIADQSPATPPATPPANPSNGVSKVLAVIKKSQLNGTEVRNTVFISCNLKHICPTVLSECDLVNTVLHETKFAKLSMENCRVTTSPLSIRRFCPELRKLVFERCVHTRDNTSPVLLVALRGNPEFYYEALECFYRQNRFRLKLANLSDYERMSKKASGAIRHLKIDFSQVDQPLPATLPSLFHECFKVEPLLMAVPAQGELFLWAKYAVETFPNLQAIRLSISMTHVQGTSRRTVRLRAGSDVLSQNLRIEGRIHRVTTSNWEICFWEAARGQTLK
ncbi:hypothetical protein IFR05_003439 [Cadophora sp. M221]|nr:hypothetical protein IFR05_003439 [Cadophora sp. M221]